MRSTLLFGVATLALHVHCLEVTAGSPCADICEGPSLTFGDDLTCRDNEYWDTAKGDTMRDCLICESTSTANNGNTSDVQNSDQYWLLFNMKYTLQYCLFQENGSTLGLPQCEDSCSGLDPVLAASWFTNPRPEQYAYCSINDAAFTQTAEICARCIQQHEGSVVLGNFLYAMQSACDTKPDAMSGESISLQRELFATATIASTTSSATTVSQTEGASATTSSPDLASTTTPADQAPGGSSSVLNTGAAAGIGVGCALVAIAVIGGLTWFILARRRSTQTATSGRDGFGKDSDSSFARTPAHAQQLASREVHEIGSSPGKGWLTELDGRPIHSRY